MTEIDQALSLEDFTKNACSEVDYRFNGKELDQETGLHYYGARYYQNRISSWLSVDPMAMEGHNVSMTPYHFSSNNPVMRVDPDGMNDKEWEVNLETGETYEVGNRGGDEIDYISYVDGEGTVLWEEETDVTNFESPRMFVDFSDPYFMPSSELRKPGIHGVVNQSIYPTFDLVDVVLGVAGGYYAGKGVGWLTGFILGRTTSETVPKSINAWR